jgi:hypothetical protein
MADDTKIELKELSVTMNCDFAHKKEIQHHETVLLYAGSYSSSLRMEASFSTYDAQLHPKK